MIVPMMPLRRGRFRVERRIERRELCAEAAQHVLQHVVAPDADFIAGDLHVGVAVAEMPGQPHGIERAAGGDFD